MSLHKTISIHALREEGDATPPATIAKPVDFYPRPPRGGRHADNVPGADCANISIHALREEGDTGEIRRKDRPIHFYPRPPRGGRPMSSFGLPLIALFLSTPSARRATSVNDLSNAVGQFLSTPSARRATASCQFLVVFLHLFLSTPSARRATRQRSAAGVCVLEFLSTPSARRTTEKRQKQQKLR